MSRSVSSPHDGSVGESSLTTATGVPSRAGIRVEGAEAASCAVVGTWVGDNEGWSAREVRLADGDGAGVETLAPAAGGRWSTVPHDTARRLATNTIEITRMAQHGMRGFGEPEGCPPIPSLKGLGLKYR